MDHVIQTPLWFGVELIRIRPLTLFLSLVLPIIPLIPLVVIVLVAISLIPLIVRLGALVIPLVIPLMWWQIGAPWIVLISASPISMILIHVSQLQLPLLIPPWTASLEGVHNL